MKKKKWCLLRGAWGGIAAYSLIQMEVYDDIYFAILLIILICIAILLEICGLWEVRG